MTVAFHIASTPASALTLSDSTFPETAVFSTALDKAHFCSKVNGLLPKVGFQAAK
jgi:hypothetical protein